MWWILTVVVTKQILLSTLEFDTVMLCNPNKLLFYLMFLTVYYFKINMVLLLLFKVFNLETIFYLCRIVYVKLCYCWAQMRLTIIPTSYVGEMKAIWLDKLKIFIFFFFLIGQCVSKRCTYYVNISFICRSDWMCSNFSAFSADAD